MAEKEYTRILNVLMKRIECNTTQTSELVQFVNAVKEIVTLHRDDVYRLLSECCDGSIKRKTTCTL